MDFIHSMSITLYDDDDDDHGSNVDHEEIQEAEVTAPALAVLRTASASSSSDPNPTPRSEPIPQWCKCGQCQTMPQDVENKCCRRRSCISLTRRFEKLCLDTEYLRLSARNVGEIRNDREDNSTRAFRKQAYRHFIIDTHGYLGKGNRRVAPSCVVCRIRRQYPSPTGVYMGFKNA